MSTSTPNTSTSASENADQSTPPAPPKTRLLLLIRHGQTAYNVEGRLPGQLPGIPLNDEGRRQAHRAAVALAALPLSTIISSPLERAAETADDHRARLGADCSHRSAPDGYRCRTLGGPEN